MKLQKIHIKEVNQAGTWIFYYCNHITINYCCKPDISYNFLKHGKYILTCYERSISISTKSEFKKDLTFLLEKYT